MKPIACLCAMALLLAFAPAASARKVATRVNTALLPAADPAGRIRSNEKKVKFTVTVTDPQAKIEALVQVFCFTKALKLKRIQRNVTGTGKLTKTLRRPRGKGLGCSASANVRVASRPSPPSGVPADTRLTATINATRR